MTEAFLQYVWQHRLLQGELTTTDGQLVTIERAGILNRDAGPDFSDARLKIGDTWWAGNVEIHIKASDWQQHHHESDRNYSSVVLHVVYEADIDIVTDNGNRLITLEIKDHISRDIWNQYEQLTQTSLTENIPCTSYLSEIPDFIVSNSLDRLTIERIQRKSDDVKHLIEESHGSWETCCYWMIARYFGGKTNGFTFELLAKATDQRLLARWKDQPQRIEAILMGQAGMLDGYFEDEYPRLLQQDYESLAKGAHLKPIDGYLWKFFRLRPHSFPTIRISQFANLISRSHNLFSNLLEESDAARLAEFFDVEASPYWTSHYQFDKESAPSSKHIGKAFVETLIINAWVPLLMEYGIQHGQQRYKDQAVAILQQLPPEENNITRKWKAVGIKADNAAQSQALIQLYNEYCTPRRCLECQIGYRILVQNNKKRQKAFLKEISAL